MISEKRIDGRAIAQHILHQLTQEVKALKKKYHVTPCIQVLFVGDNPASESFITQKKNAAEAIGAKMILTKLPETTTAGEVESVLSRANKNFEVHGFIIQLPLPAQTTVPQGILDLVAKQKDIDGFVTGSPFAVPVAAAVITILEHIHTIITKATPTDFIPWLRSNSIVITGKGITGGKPIAKTLKQLNVPYTVIDRSTPSPDEIIGGATLILSCAGQPGLIKASVVKENVILISVGVKKIGSKIVGDYSEEEIDQKARFYTPTPGGVGPVNVACLMQNLVKAYKLQLER